MNKNKVTDNQEYLKRVGSAIRAGKISISDAIEASTIRHQGYNYMLAERLKFPSHTFISIQDAIWNDDGQEKKIILPIQNVVAVDAMDDHMIRFEPEQYKQKLIAMAGGAESQKLFSFGSAVMNAVETNVTDSATLLSVIMKETLQFLKERGTFYLATVEDNKPHLRPFGAITEFENKLYIVTSSTKNVYKQIIKNPNIAICVCDENRKWLRIKGIAKADDRIAVKQKMLDDNPVLIMRKRYTSAQDPTMKIFYIDNAEIEFN